MATLLVVLIFTLCLKLEPPRRPVRARSPTFSDAERTAGNATHCIGTANVRIEVSMADRGSLSPARDGQVRRLAIAPEGLVAGMTVDTYFAQDESRRLRIRNGDGGMSELDLVRTGDSRLRGRTARPRREAPRSQLVVR
jgi:hypothetical protein